MKTKWAPFAKVLIVVFALVLFANALALFSEVRQDMRYNDRSYGLSQMNDAFDRGDYQSVYLESLANKYTSTPPEVDTGQYEAFGRWYHAYVLAHIYPDNAAYLEQMAQAKEQIAWEKVLDVVARLEAQG